MGNDDLAAAEGTVPPALVIGVRTAGALIPTLGCSTRHSAVTNLQRGEVFLAFAGYRDPDHPVHQAIAGLDRDDPLQVNMGTDHCELLADNGMVVGQLACNFTAPAGAGSTYAIVMAIVAWDAERSEPEYRSGLRTKTWEVVVPELVFEPER